MQRSRRPIAFPATPSSTAGSPGWRFVLQHPVLHGNHLINSPFSAPELVSGREEVSGGEGGGTGRDLYQGARLRSFFKPKLLSGS